MPFDFRFINFPPKIAIILKNINPWKEEMGMYYYFSFRFKNDFVCSQNFKLFNFSLIFYLKLIFFFVSLIVCPLFFFLNDNLFQEQFCSFKNPSLLKTTLPKMPISTESNPKPIGQNIHFLSNTILPYAVIYNRIHFTR